MKALTLSTEAEFDDRFSDAVKAALEAKGLVKEPSAALGERITSRTDALEKLGRERLGEATALKDAAKRTKAIGAVASDFKGLPVSEAATATMTAK